MPSICFCNTTKSWGGGEKWHLDNAIHFAKKGWKVYFICYPNKALHVALKKYPEICLLPIAIGKFSFFSLKIKQQLKNFFKKNSINYLIVNDPSDLKCVVPVARKMGVEKIVYRRGSAIPIKNSFWNRKLFSMLDGFVANSNQTLKLALKNNTRLIEPYKTIIIPNGIDILAFDNKLKNNTPKFDLNNIKTHATDPKKEFIQKVTFLKSLNPNILIIGNAGRLTTQKGQHYLLFLAKELKKKNFQFHLIIAGEGDLFNELLELSVKLNVSDHVTFTGFLPDLSYFWNFIDIFFLSSIWEGFGYVIIESMLAKKPVFAFNVSNIPELIDNNSTGKLFNLPNNLNGEYNMEQIAGTIIKSSNSSELQQIAVNARRFAEENFSLESSTKKLELWLLSL